VDCLKAIRSNLVDGTYVWNSNDNINQEFLTEVVPGRNCANRLQEFGQPRGRVELSEEQKEHLTEEYFKVIQPYVDKA
jgi:hypothetical protein